MKEVTLPGWTKMLPDNSAMSAKDLAFILGYKSSKSLNSAINTGRFPPADRLSGHNTGLKSSGWSLGLLRKLEAKQLEGK